MNPEWNNSSAKLFQDFLDNFGIVLFLLASVPLLSQEHISTLSQNTNKYIATYDNLTYISSIEGLNIYDGSDTRVYRSSSQNMKGDNIQSEFYRDSLGNIWFCTYEAINVFSPTDREFENYQGIHNSVIADNDYRIICLEDNVLWFLADSRIYLFDIIKKSIIQSFESPYTEVTSIRKISRKSKIDFISVSDEGLLIYSCGISDYEAIDTFNFEVPMSSLLIKNEREAYLGTYSGELLVFDIIDQKFLGRKKISENLIVGINNYSDEEVILSSAGDVSIVNFREKEISPSVTTNGIFSELKKIQTIYTSSDSTRWIANDGDGVYYLNEQKLKFPHFLESNSSISITSIYRIPSTTDFLITTRGKGLYIIDRKGEILASLPAHKNKELYIISGLFVDESRFVFCNQGFFYSYNTKTYEIIELQQSGANLLYGIDMQELNDGTKVVIDYSNIIYSFVIEDENIVFRPIYTPTDENDLFFSIESVKDSVHFVSNNEVMVDILLSGEGGIMNLAHSLDIAGGVKSVCESSTDDEIYLSNSAGLFTIDLTNYSYSQIPGPEDVFLQNIYAIEKVDDERYYLSTNQGLYFWNPMTDSVHQFTMSDGLQGLEFNTDAHYQDEDGRLFFGGVNGLNVFHPDSIKLMDHEAPVMLTEYMLDDTISTAFGMPHYVSEMELPYSQNTISFTFHALDYSGMEDARVKYMLEGYDNEFLYSKGNIGSVRYPNLPPGNYTFSIVGANADKVWNKTTREVEITIHPPYWQTWWFRLLALLVIGGIIYLIFRSYYTRKLREKDFKLKEQELIIAKQNALQAERNRIAGEMHDDLGGGLTTIRYLSQRIKGNLKDEKSEKQLLKIIDHSKDLVSNMSEIIWAMNSGFDRLDSLIAYTRRYSKEYLETYSIAVHFSNNVPDSKIILTGEIRRNIFLVCKEILHNVAKHSQATEVNLSFDIIENSLRIELSDNGIGLQEVNNLGNGLKTMENRMKVIEGKISRVSKNGLSYQLDIPLEKLKE